MEWLTVIALILFGTSLLIAEIVFIPGVFVAGLLGISATSVGVFLSYDYFGSPIGHFVLIGAIVVNIVGLVVVFRGRSWEAFSLKDVSMGRINEGNKIDLKIGDKGITLSVLKPVGKGLFEDREYEVSSHGGYISENENIEIVNILSSKILVKKI